MKAAGEKPQQQHSLSAPFDPSWSGAAAVAQMAKVVIWDTSWSGVISYIATLRVLQSHGFLINEIKSHFEPMNRLLHLGAWIDMVACQVFLS